MKCITRHGLRLLLILILLSSAVNMVLADGGTNEFTGPYVDSYLGDLSSNPILNNSTGPYLGVGSGDTPGIPPNDCRSRRSITYIQFTLPSAALAANIVSASFGATIATTVPMAQAGTTLSLSSIASDLTAEGTPAGSGGALLQALTMTAPAKGVTYTFGGTDTALRDYIKTQAQPAGDGVVTLALEVTAGCPNTQLNGVWLWSQEGASDPAYASQNPVAPQLSVIYADPTAVTLRDFQGHSSSLGQRLWVQLHGWLGTNRVVLR